MTATAILAPVKTCNKCCQVKPIGLFDKAKSCIDGHRGSCKACGATNAAKRAAKWRASHPEKAKEVDRRYREANPEKVKETRAEHYRRNAEKYQAAHRQFYAENKELSQSWSREWVANNKERRSAYAAARWADNMQACKAAYAKWEAANPDIRRAINRNRRARILASGGKLSKDLDSVLLVLQQGKCACCGKPLGTDYHADHIMPIALGGANTDDNIQLLRKRCNLRKGAMHPDDYAKKRILELNAT